MRPAVSVIVLVYKVEEYIARCARTLFGQTLHDVEFIIVDDCSPDRSMEILTEVLENEFPWRRSQVRILRNGANRGQAYSRRRGIESATGEYTIHCDSDDWLELNMLERLYNEACTHGADIAVCGWFRDDVPVPTGYDREGVNLRDRILDNMVAVGEIQPLWRYLVRRELYSKGIDFPVLDQGEDHALMVQLVWYSRKVHCVREPLYHWRTNLDSITRNPSPESVIRRFEGDCGNARLVEAFLSRQGARGRFASQLVALKLYSAFDLRPLLRRGECIGRWRNEFPEIRGKVLSNKHVSFAHKLEFLIDMYCPAAVVKAVYRWRSYSR